MKKNSGFANPEYMIALAAIGIILALIIPAVSNARAGRRNRAALATVRSALARYAAETKTKGPVELADLTKDRKYLAAIPPVSIPGRHGPSAQVRALGVTDDTGGWTYSNWPSDPREGEVWINCTHTDNHGKAWKDY